jgi:hypothetical protein
MKPMQLIKATLKICCSLRKESRLFMQCLAFVTYSIFKFPAPQLHTQTSAYDDSEYDMALLSYNSLLTFL